MVAGEALIARADRTLYWPSESTLFVADVHLGKTETFQTLGVPVPDGATQTTLDRLSASVLGSGAERLVLLGDLWHSARGRTRRALSSLASWRSSFSDLAVTLVIGNHDLSAGPLPPELGISEVEEASRLGPFSLLHDPRACSEPYGLAGHIHPGVELSGRGRQSMRLPCFWFGPECGVLPPFGECTGCGRIRPCVGDQVIAVADGRLWAVAGAEVV